MCGLFLIVSGQELPKTPLDPVMVPMDKTDLELFKVNMHC